MIGFKIGYAGLGFLQLATGLSPATPPNISTPPLLRETNLTGHDWPTQIAENARIPSAVSFSGCGTFRSNAQRRAAGNNWLGTFPFGCRVRVLLCCVCSPAATRMKQGHPHPAISPETPSPPPPAPTTIVPETKITNTVAITLDPSIATRSPPQHRNSKPPPFLPTVWPDGVALG